MKTSTEEYKINIKELEDELQSIISYWKEKMVDNEYGGFYGQRDGYDVLIKNAPKGIILNTRILWTFSKLSNYYKDDITLLDLADRAYTYVRNNFLDEKHGGAYWLLDHRGNVLESKKQIYAQAFTIYAFSEYYRLTGKEESLQYAISIFKLIEAHSFDSFENGYFEAFDREWKLLEDMRLSEKDENEKKTMNTHLHLLEAYTNLYKVWNGETLHNQLKNLILIFRDKIINKGHLNLFFDEKWQVKSKVISFGHDIECSWLLQEAAECINDSLLNLEIKKLSIQMVDNCISWGFDEQGGVFYEAEEEYIKDHDKHWWPQAEAMVGFINAWQNSSDQKYLDNFEKVWKFIKIHIKDKENGEWHWRVDHQNRVIFSEDKAGPWKGPYHNSRAILEVITRLKK